MKLISILSLILALLIIYKCADVPDPIAEDLTGVKCNNCFLERGVIHVVPPDDTMYGVPKLQSISHEDFVPFIQSKPPPIQEILDSCSELENYPNTPLWFGNHILIYDLPSVNQIWMKFNDKHGDDSELIYSEVQSIAWDDTNIKQAVDALLSGANSVFNSIDVGLSTTSDSITFLLETDIEYQQIWFLVDATGDGVENYAITAYPKERALYFRGFQNDIELIYQRLEIRDNAIRVNFPLAQLNPSLVGFVYNDWALEILECYKEGFYIDFENTHTDSIIQLEFIERDWTTVRTTF